VRLGDPVAAARRLPPGAGVIYRAFGAADALATATALKTVARRRGLTLLIGADEALALAVGAHGLHLPERLLGLGRSLRARHPGWVVTGAAHSGLALRRAQRAGCVAALISPVFPSRSPSAGPALGQARLALLARRLAIPVIALGGVNNKTAPGLVRTGAYGLAAVEGLSA
jgi:thiamine-phosphate pyrophosphorylase